MKRGRRDFQVFSLSFLDVICCGFGAIILLLVLTKIGQPLAIEEARRDLDRRLIELDAELHEIRGETPILDRRLKFDSTAVRGAEPHRPSARRPLRAPWRVRR